MGSSEHVHKKIMVKITIVVITITFTFCMLNIAVASIFLHWTRRVSAQGQATHLKMIGDARLDESW